ncbi:MAG: GNAT family N-acetyltransferase [Eubacteriales bacterium]|nr:GNAT family N-acetyltransferase [Eubacteriales bacterium]
MPGLALLHFSQITEDAYWDYLRDWQSTGERIVPFASAPHDLPFSMWRSQLQALEDPACCPAHLVPATLYFLSDGSALLGAVDIRHTLNGGLAHTGGHIGYGVRPSCRRQGYACAMLGLALPLAHDLGIRRALITCDDTNAGSARVIEKAGGVLENKVSDGDHLIRRYWVATR